MYERLHVVQITAEQQKIWLPVRKLCKWLITYRVRVYLEVKFFALDTYNKTYKISKSPYRINETSVKRLIWIKRHREKSDISKDSIQNNKHTHYIEREKKETQRERLTKKDWEKKRKVISIDEFCLAFSLSNPFFSINILQ